MLSAEPRLVNAADGYAPKLDDWPLTRFKHRDRNLGHGFGIWLFGAAEKVNSSPTDDRRCGGAGPMPSASGGDPSPR